MNRWRKRYVVREVLFEVVESKIAIDATVVIVEEETIDDCPGVVYEQATLTPVAVGPTLFSGETTIQPFKTHNWIGAKGTVFQEFDSHNLEGAVFEGDDV